jgi:putative aldouronate transport system permease protein
MTAKAQALKFWRRPRVRESRSDLIFMVCLYTFLVLLILVFLYPLIYVVSASLSDPTAVMSGQVMLLPVGFTLEAYRTIFEYAPVWTGFVNSIFYAVVGTLVNLLVTIAAAYPLSRKDLYGRNVILFLFVFTMLFSGGLIPTYLTVKNLGLLNTRWALIVPQALSVWYLIVTITYLRTSIPGDLLEAAQLDGCSDLQYLVHIILPLSSPILAVLALFYAVEHWNQYFAALVYLTDKDLFPLQIVLRDILVRNQVDLTLFVDIQTYEAKEAMRILLRYALIVVASVPVLVIYPFVQSYFVKGVMIGALKG